MTTINWRSLVGGIAPILGTAFGGPLGGEAMSLLGAALGLGDKPSDSDIAATLGNGHLTGDQIVAIRQAGDTLQARLKELDIDVLKLNAATEQSYVSDTSDARHSFATDDKVFWLGIVILTTFAASMAIVLYGMYIMLTGKVEVSPALIGVACTLVGTIIGYLASNAQQVVNFFFGSSKGSKDASASLQTALTTSMQQVGAAASSNSGSTL